MLASDINVTVPPGSQEFCLPQQMSPSCCQVILQSSEELVHSTTTHNHELAAVTPKQDKKGKRKTSASDEANESGLTSCKRNQIPMQILIFA